MKTIMRKCLVLLVVLAGFQAVLAYTSAETNHLVWALLKRARMQDDNIVDMGKANIIPDFSNPDVFFAMESDVPWTRVEKEAAFNSFLESMWSVDLGSNSRVGSYGVPNPVSAVHQCVMMNYTNAVPAIRRFAMNPTLEAAYRRIVVRQCIRLGMVDDAMTGFIETFLTNRTDFVWRDRRIAFCYADKIAAMAASNLVQRSVCDRAAKMFYDARIDDDWEYAVALDDFLSKYDLSYAGSSNRLDLLEKALSSTNLPGHVDVPFVRARFVSLTNTLHGLEQPLPQWRLIEVGERYIERKVEKVYSK